MKRALLATGLLACPAVERDSGLGVDTAPVASPYGMETRPSNSECLAMARPTSDSSLTITPIFTELSFSQPVDLIPGLTGRWLLAEQTGRILEFSDDETTEESRIVLDLSAVTNPGFETGLLGIAIHPDFEENGQLFVNYTLEQDGEISSRISRFQFSTEDTEFDPESEEILIELEQPYENHNGGDVAFGPDGLLYASFGDGGAAGDPLGHGQNPFTMLGTIIRIDVDSASPYAIPEDNPFSTGSNGAPEVYAYGFRNVWRFGFDTETGQLWAGDVGQYRAEEIDRVEPGGNYGWNIMEGDDCYGAETCESGGLIPPVVTYPNTSGASVVAGPVYRGNANPDLIGTLLFTDFYDGSIRAIVYDDITGEPEIEVLAETHSFISSFGVDRDGEVVALDYYGGRILRLDPETGDSEENENGNEVPHLLSDTGCMNPDEPSRPAEGLIPYGVQHPFWSDGATKERWLALPDGETIEIDAQGDWLLPIGSVLIKQFSLGSQLLETRLFMRHEDGNWAGYSYAWNEDGTEATLLAGSARREFGEFEWQYPSRAECLQCHTSAAGGTLGLETAQLNGTHEYVEGSAHQLLTLEHIGLIDLGTEPSELPALVPRTEGSESARSLLHVNCGSCHRPVSTGGGNLDLRWDQDLDQMGICGLPPEHGDLGVSSALLLAPGEPSRSVLSLRMHATDHSRMPPVASTIVDTVGTRAVDDWIEELENCFE